MPRPMKLPKTKLYRNFRLNKNIPAPIAVVPGPYHDELLDLIKRLLINDQLQLAEIQLNHLRELFPGSLAVIRTQAIVHAKRKQFDEAKVCFDRFFLALPFHVDASTEYFELLRNTFPEAVLQHFEALVNYVPLNANVWKLLGNMRMLTKNEETGWKAYETALSLGGQPFAIFLAAAQFSTSPASKVKALSQIEATNDLSADEQIKIAEMLYSLGSSVEGATQKGGHFLQAAANRFPELSPTYVVMLTRLITQVADASAVPDVLSESLGKPLSSAVRKELLLINAAPQRYAHLKHIRSQHQRVAVIYSYFVRARDAKLSVALRSQGWKVILLYGATFNVNISRHFDESYNVRSVDEVQYLARHIKPDIIHAIALDGDDFVVGLIEDHACPILFDTADIFEGDRDSNYSSMHYQRYGLERADGVVCRDLQTLTAYRGLGYKRPRHTIIFQEYCWGNQSIYEQVIQRRKRPRNPGEVKCVISGNFYPKPQEEGMLGYVGMAKQFADAGVHLHFFPAWMHSKISDAELDQRFPGFKELERTTPYVKLNHSLPVDDVIPALADYDFAIHVSGNSLVQGLSNTDQPIHCFYGAGTRYADYLEAALPVVFSPHHRLAFRTYRDLEMLIDDRLLVSDLKGSLLKYRDEPWLERAQRGWATYSLAKNAPRLVRFYEKVIADQKKN